MTTKSNNLGEIAMKNPIAHMSQRTAAIVAGYAFLIMVIAVGFAYSFTINLIVPGDAATTVNNIMESEILFRRGIAGWLIVLICDLVVALALYVFLKQVNKSLSLLTAWLRVVYTTIFGVMLINFLAILHILSGADYLKVFETAQLHSLVLLFFNIFHYGWLFGLVFFALHLFGLGYLVLKSDYVPKIFGILLIIASFGYMVESFGNILLPNYENYEATIKAITIVPNTIGELSFAFWLLFKGGKTSSKDTAK